MYWLRMAINTWTEAYCRSPSTSLSLPEAPASKAAQSGNGNPERKGLRVVVVHFSDSSALFSNKYILYVTLVDWEWEEGEHTSYFRWYDVDSLLESIGEWISSHLLSGRVLAVHHLHSTALWNIYGVRFRWPSYQPQLLSRWLQ